MATAPSFLDYLKQLQDQGKTHVYLDQRARGVLRELFLESRGIAPKQAQSVASTPAVNLRPSAPASVAPSQKTQPAAQPPIIATVTAPTTGSPAEKIAALANQAEQWRPAQALGTLRQTMVFSTGNPEADIMLIGEAPGFQEEKQKQPFVGPAGAKLDGILKAMGIERGHVYISNIVKFRPAMENQTTGNRKPTQAEMDCCLPFIREEIAIVKPRCIIALGGTAAEGLLGGNERVSQRRGHWHQFANVPVRVSYHPSYLLHNADSIRDKRAVWEDMLAVMKHMDMPISDKQQAYFTKSH